MFCAVALGIDSAVRLAVAAEDSVGVTPAKASPAILWSQIGVPLCGTGPDYKGHGLAVTPSAEGARLRCDFQRLEGEATREGLWLTSRTGNGLNDRFRVVAVGVGRQPSIVGDEVTSLTSKPGIRPESVSQRMRKRQRTAALQNLSAARSVSDGAPASGSAAVPCRFSQPPTPLASEGTVSIEGQSVRFARPGLVEEYTVTMDGLRQDFIVLQRPSLFPSGGEGRGEGELHLQLAVTGARVEPAATGAVLVLNRSGRKIAYTRLRVTDATGRELPARMEILSDGVRPSSGNATRIWALFFCA